MSHVEVRIRVKSLIAILTGLWLSWGSASMAQDLETREDLAEFCRLAAPQGDAAYQADRQSLLQRDVSVRVKFSEVSYTYDASTELAQLTLPTGLPRNSQSLLKIETPERLFVPFARLRAEELDSKSKLGMLDVVLRVVSAAVRNTEVTFCTREDETQIIRVEVLEVSIDDEARKTLLSFDTELGLEVKLRRGLGWPAYLGDAVPEVDLHEASRAKGNADSQESPEKASLPAQEKSQLKQLLSLCYLRGLRKNARLQGALVVEWDDGDTKARVAVDSVQDGDVSTCVTEKIAAFASSRAASLENGSWRMTIFLKLTSTSRL